MNHLPAYLWALTYAEVAGIAAATAYALYRGARAALLGNRVSTRLGLGAALLFGGWLAVSSLVADGAATAHVSGTASLGCHWRCSASSACC